VKEKLQEYALIAEIVGGVALIVSLAFVGLQLRQSNALTTTDAVKDGTQIWTTAYVAAFGSEESTAFLRRALNHCEDLSDDERGRFFATLMRFVAAYDNIFNQYEGGRLRQEIFASIASDYYGIAEMPCAHAMLSQDTTALPPWLLSSAGIENVPRHSKGWRSWLVEQR
jgi:hypothetical protein